MEAIANPSSLEGETPCCIDYDDRPREGGYAGRLQNYCSENPGQTVLNFPAV